MIHRRTFLLALAALSLGPAAASDYAPVRPGRRLVFPTDHGGHPAFRNEWWYATGWLDRPDGSPLGFQATLFRVRTGLAEDNPSAFAPRQLILAHAALADPGRGRLLHDQRAARAGFGRAGYTEGETRVWIGDWQLERLDGTYHARVASREFAYALTLAPAGPPLLHGAAGFSAKAADPRYASHYYSVPQLRVSGRVRIGSEDQPVTGRAWLDHEWSSELLPPGARGWDWVGLNFADGGALMAFRLRRGDATALWSGATWRAPDGSDRVLPAAAVLFTPLRQWRSPRTGIAYPVVWELRVDSRRFLLQPLVDDQELDSRPSTGALYWEGAVRVLEDNREVGRGYLEMTGYGDALRVG